MRASWRIGLFIASSSLAACGRWDTVSFTDEGNLCFIQDGPDVEVQVTAPECLSSSCTRDVEASCEASAEGTTIVIDSEIQWEETQGRPGQGCTLDCGMATATCRLPALPEGGYTVMHGDAQRAIVVPITEPCDLI